MISDHDRSGWFGASDVSYIMRSWETRTFARWWMQKLGLNHDHYTNNYIAAGTYYEHKILDFVGAKEKDKQILIPSLRLQVNLDGNTGNHIFEVKTHKSERFRLPQSYIQQVNIQMYAMGDSTAEIVAYRLEEEDYKNFFRDIDPDRITRWPIARDEEFLREYLKKLRYLGDCLRVGSFPKEAEYEDNSGKDQVDRRLRGTMALRQNESGPQDF